MKHSKPIEGEENNMNNARSAWKALRILLASMIVMVMAWPVQMGIASAATNKTNMPANRQLHRAVTMVDGNVMVTGGNDGVSESATTIIYNPTLNSWTYGASMLTARFSHAATVLKDGRVMVIGGNSFSSSGVLSSVEIYSPQSSTWSSAAPLAVPRAAHTATTLPDGRVFVVGGGNDNGDLASTEIYDPVTNAWAAGPSMPQTRKEFGAALMGDGRVLVSGGTVNGSMSNSALIYDPLTNSWSSAANMPAMRYIHGSTTLEDGRVSVAGGFDPNYSPLATTVIYDPETNSWTSGPSMNVGLIAPEAVLLQDGNVFVAGGAGNSGPTNHAETFKPVPRTSVPKPSVTGGEVSPDTNVSLSTYVNGVTIYYTTDGSTPTTASPVYSAQIVVNGPMTLKAIAYRSDWGSSQVMTANYTVNVVSPVVTNMNPTSGPTTGGTAVTLTGSNFTGATGVTFGGVAGTGFTVVSDTEIEVTTPAGAAFNVPVEVQGAASTHGDAGSFEYLQVPVISGISPQSGPAAGGTPVTLTGSAFIGTTGVTFGGITGVNFTVVNDTTITVTAPAGTPGPVDVKVQSPIGDGTLSNGFTYLAPAIADISPNAGPEEGGQTVTLTGTEFTGATDVTFGGVPATSFTVDSDTQISAVVPAGTAGMVDVSVTAPNGIATAEDGYKYVAAPVVTDLDPASGPMAGGTVVLLTGQNFTGAMGVKFGGVSGTSLTVISDTEIKVTTPAGTVGTVDVEVQGAASTKADVGNFEYLALPTITDIQPNAGPEGGGQSVTLTGSKFTGATDVTFGGVPATSFTVDSDSQIEAVVPAGEAGMVDVSVTSPNGKATADDGYTYVAAPVVTNMHPTSGPKTGGTAVTLTGSNFTGATGVMFGGVAGTGFTVVSDTKIEVITPAGAAGIVAVEVHGAGSTKGDAGDFEYLALPMITDIDPSAGPEEGGQTVTLTGTKFTGATNVKFGGVPATSFTVDSDTQITAVVPAGAAGTVDVSVTAPNGIATAEVGYTYQLPKEVTPLAAIDYSNERLAGLVPNAAYTVNGVSLQADGSGKIAIDAGWLGASIAIVKLGDGAATTDSQAQTLSIPERAAAPEVTADDAADTIVGLSATMEFSLDGAAYVKFDGTNAPSLTGTHTVSVRIAATASELASAVKTLTYTSPVLTDTPAANDIIVLVNGKQENAGKATISLSGKVKTTTFVVDPAKLQVLLNTEGQRAVVTIPVNNGSNVVIGELDGRMVKSMEGNQAIVEIKTEQATYTLPAAQINIDDIAKKLDGSVDLKDIKVRITIAEPSSDSVQVVKNASDKNGLSLVLPPLEFTVTTAYGDRTIEVSKFNAYVKRTIAIPDGVDPSRITTGIVVDPDGTIRHVPTKIVQNSGKYYAEINSLTNSTYSVVWHPLTFADMENHWAKTAVNDMGSRFIINGVSETTFKPNAKITRAEFAAIIVRGLGLKLGEGANPFADVMAGAWYESAIQTAAAYGLINGFEDGTFRPNAEITREQALAVIAKAMTTSGLKDKLQGQDASAMFGQFTDANAVAAWAKDSVSDTLLPGIVSGRDGKKLDPKALVTRAEVAVMIRNLLIKSDLI